MNSLHDKSIIQNEIIIYYSKWKTALLTLTLVFMLGLIVKFLGFSFVGVVILSLGAYYSYWQLREFLNAIMEVPQIIINKTGIQTISTPFYKWTEIQNEKVIAVGSLGSSRASVYYLTYEHPKGIENLRIGTYNTSKEQLSKLLIHFRLHEKINN
ncbi:hypothetical protein MASR1M45_06860 [Candidatus Kapaibacterium sp.]